jgi:hypothetical protein
MSNQRLHARMRVSLPEKVTEIRTNLHTFTVIPITAGSVCSRIFEVNLNYESPTHTHTVVFNHDFTNIPGSHIYNRLNYKIHKEQ